MSIIFITPLFLFKEKSKQVSKVNFLFKMTGIQETSGLNHELEFFLKFDFFSWMVCFVLIIALLYAYKCFATCAYVQEMFTCSEVMLVFGTKAQFSESTSGVLNCQSFSASPLFNVD